MRKFRRYITLFINIDDDIKKCAFKLINKYYKMKYLYLLFWKEIALYISPSKIIQLIIHEFYY